MCRNIRTLYNFEPPATPDEIQAAALQFVRKVSGFTKPSQANEFAFSAAIEEVSVSVQRLIDSLSTTSPSKDREAEDLKARQRSAKRFGS
jgi:hypothetical protein